MKYGTVDFISSNLIELGGRKITGRIYLPNKIPYEIFPVISERNPYVFEVQPFVDGHILSIVDKKGKTVIFVKDRRKETLIGDESLASEVLKETDLLNEEKIDFLKRYSNCFRPDTYYNIFPYIHLRNPKAKTKLKTSKLNILSVERRIDQNSMTEYYVVNVYVRNDKVLRVNVRPELFDELLDILSLARNIKKSNSLYVEVDDYRVNYFILEDEYPIFDIRFRMKPFVAENILIKSNFVLVDGVSSPPVMCSVNSMLIKYLLEF